MLAVAHHKGWLAGAGPDCLVLADTKSVRDAFTTKPESEDGKIRPFTPKIKLPMQGRVTHVAFSSDETFLITSSEAQGSLIVFHVQDLLNGSTQPAFQIPTSGESLRSLLPNPAKEKAELVAVVTTQGNLLMANMKTRQFESGPATTGNVLRANTSCVAWSTRGKQLVAGSADGTFYQMTPDGNQKAHLPRAPDLQGDFYVDSIAWIEKDLFFVAYVSMGGSKDSEFRLVTRDGAGTKFQKAKDINFPTDVDRAPHNAVVRLKDFPPYIQDMLIVSSSVSPDVGILTRTKSPLSKDSPNVVNVFATSPPADDARRASVPGNEDWEDTWVVGASLDLSSTEKVYQPIKDDEELEYSSGPLPGYWLLNHEGILIAWWVVYDESVRQGTTFSGMAALSPETGAAAAQNGFAGSSNVASPLGAARPALPFGEGSKSPSFSASAGGATPTFGSTSALGQSSSPWSSSARNTASGTATTAAKFGQPGFDSGSPSDGFRQSSISGFGRSAPGQPSPLGSNAPAFGQTSPLGAAAVFGQASRLGSVSSPWASAAASSTSVFGQSGFSAAGQAKPFGSSESNKSPKLSGSGFASFANSGGFGSVARNSIAGGQSIFAQASVGNSFVSDVSMSSSFGAPAKFNPLASANPFSSDSSGLSKEAFKLGTTFQRDPDAVGDKPQSTDQAFSKPSGSTNSMFGSEFGSALGAATSEPTPTEVDMDVEESTPKPTQAKPVTVEPPASQQPQAIAESTTPTTTPAASRFTPAPTSETPPFSSTSQQTSELVGPKKDDTVKAQTQLPNSNIPFGGNHEKTQPSPNPFSDVKDVKSTFSVGTPSDKESISLSPRGESTPPGGVFGDVSKDTTGSSIFENRKHPQPENLLTSQSESESTMTTLKETRTGAADGPSASPLPPESTSKSSYPFGNSASSRSSSGSTLAKLSYQAEAVENAPLSPDFIETKKGSVEVRPDIPPDPAPLPPDPSTMPKATLPPVPSPSPAKTAPSKELLTPPNLAKLGSPVAIFSSIPPVSDSLDGDDSSEAGCESEGSGVDVAEDLSPPGSATKTPGFTPQSSFAGMAGSTFSSISRPEQQPRLFGEIRNSLARNAPVLPNPKPSILASPRSPSPVRGVPAPVTSIRNNDIRSVSAPGMASQILGNSRMRHQQPITQSGFGESITGKAMPLSNPMEPHLRAKAKREAEEAQVLVDEEDDHIQRVLAAEINPKCYLDEFIAHSNSEAAANESIPAQVEAVYRDINSMIDTLGLNSRSLAAFVQGHSRLSTEGQRGWEDLEDPDNWVLCEVEDLNDKVEIYLVDDLEKGRVRDIETKKEDCADLLRNINRLRIRYDDLRKVLMAITDPDMTAASRTLPLSSEQSAQQAELRKEYMAFSKQLAEIEEALVMLKTKVATVAASSGKSGTGGAVPTVDAVIRTIQRMTSMAEKRSGDIDVLESQMRKLRLGSLGPNTPRGREGSPFVATTPANRRLHSGSVFSPGRSLPLGGSVMSVGSSGSSGRGTPRKKLSGFTNQEKRELMAKKRAMKEMLDKLKKSLEKAGPRVIPLDE